jgi:hypothetical protein
MFRACVVTTAFVLSGCSRMGDLPAAVDAALPQTQVSSDVARPSATSRPATIDAWSGHYAAAPGSFSVPDGGEWAGVRFRGEDAGDGLGEGTLSVSVDPAGRVTGTLEGPLGPARLTGELLANAFSAAVSPSDPGHGFAGTAVGTLAGDRIAGTIRLSMPTGNVLRAASFALERKR